MSLVVILDFDGVIVDSVAGLYNCFGKFLKIYGHAVDQKSFDHYNGMKIEDILIDAKKKYKIPNHYEELRESYEKLIQEVYQECELTSGVNDFLDYCDSHNIKVCIASGTKRKDLERVIDRFDLNGRFQFIITGDEVNKAKPNPEMFLEIRKEMGDSQYLVVDDSVNGIEAAIRAKMSPIHFVNNYNTSNHFSVSSFMELTSVITEYILKSQPKYEFEKITTEIVSLNSIESTDVNKYWNLIIKDNPSLFNGSLFQVMSFSFKNSKKNIHLQLSKTDYKNLHFQNFFLKKENKKKSLISLGVSGVVMNLDGNILVGKRKSNSYTYPDFFELPPSGTVEPDQGNLEEQLIRELNEETGIKKDNISNIKPMINYFDEKSSVLDVAYLISLNCNLTIPKKSEEYSELSFKDISKVKDLFFKRQVVATSRILLNLL